MPVHMKTYRLALGSILTALCVVCMYFTQLLPTMRLALAALACLLMAVLVSETGPYYALIAYAAAGVLSVLLAPTLGWLFVGFFGWYPSAKCLIERLRSGAAQWSIKLACFLASAAALYFLVSGLVGTLFPRFAGMPLLLLAAGAVGFVLFDLALGKFIIWYIAFLRPKININRG